MDDPLGSDGNFDAWIPNSRDDANDDFDRQHLTGRCNEPSEHCAANVGGLPGGATAIVTTTWGRSAAHFQKQLDRPAPTVSISPLQDPRWAH
ncbi:MAG: hypothetical protein R3E12_01435 [Candidatus Eisenbacteria bacterium]